MWEPGPVSLSRGRPVVLVTRADGQAAPWLEGLAARGWPVAGVPLLGIAAAPDPTALVAAWAGLRGRAAVMFVSPNAVERFFAARPPACTDHGWPAGTVAASTGPGTSRALREAGVPPQAIVEPPDDADAFDSEHLWPCLAGLRDWHGTEVLVVRGDGGRDWLTARWRAAGARVDPVEAYRRIEPTWTPAQAALADAARQRPADHLWLFSSSEAVRTLSRRWSVPAGARAIATHPAIAATTREAGFAQVLSCPPQLDAVAACLESALSPTP